MPRREVDVLILGKHSKPPGGHAGRDLRVEDGLHEWTMRLVPVAEHVSTNVVHQPMFVIEWEDMCNPSSEQP